MTEFRPVVDGPLDATFATDAESPHATDTPGDTRLTPRRPPPTGAPIPRMGTVVAMARKRGRLLRRATILGGLAAGLWSWRQRQLEANRRRFNLP